MNNRLTILCDEIKQIHEQYVQQVGPSGRKAWPKAIKERALEVDRLVNSTKEAAELTGLSADLFYYWRSQAKKSGFKSLAVVEKKSPSVTVTVTTPKGYMIEGLPADMALEFLLKVRG
jgi:hypothetical protein